MDDVAGNLTRRQAVNALLWREWMGVSGSREPRQEPGVLQIRSIGRVSHS